MSGDEENPLLLSHPQQKPVEPDWLISVAKHSSTKKASVMAPKILVIENKSS
jgi:hypothetical protein